MRVNSMIIYLTIWFPGGGIIWEGLGGMTLLEMCCWAWAWRFEKPMPFPIRSHYLLHADKGVNSPFFSIILTQTYLHAIMFPTTMVINANPVDYKLPKTPSSVS